MQGQPSCHLLATPATAPHHRRPDLAAADVCEVDEPRMHIHDVLCVDLRTPSQAGTHQPLEGQTSCKPCSEKVVCPDEAMEASLPCGDANAIANADGTACICSVGFFAAKATPGPDGNIGVKCLECPAGLQCREVGLAWGPPWKLSLIPGAWQKRAWLEGQQMTAEQFLELPSPIEKCPVRLVRAGEASCCAQKHGPAPFGGDVSRNATERTIGPD